MAKAARSVVANTRICQACVANPYLTDLFLPAGSNERCDFCAQIGQTVTLSLLATRVDALLREHFRSVSRNDSVEGTRLEPMEVVENLVCCSGPVAAKIWELLQEFERPRKLLPGQPRFYADGVQFVEIQVDLLFTEILWHAFSLGLKHFRRFASNLSEPLEHFLGEFDALGDGKALRVLSVADEIYRGRLARTMEEASRFAKRPIPELCPPMPEQARSGRMNPEGIAVFYGGSTRQVCIDEVRAPVGAFVVTAKFRPARPLKILDLTDVHEMMVTSLFRGRSRAHFERAIFLKHFHEWITMPVLPDDARLDYVPTQAVAEYLVDGKKLDGIMYGSVQNGQLQMDDAPQDHPANICLFRDASRVVGDRRPHMGRKSPHKTKHGLRCVRESVEVHRITRVCTSFETEDIS